MKKKGLGRGYGRGSARVVAAAVGRVIGYPTAAAGALWLAGCGEEAVPPAVAAEPGVRMEPLPTSTAAAQGALHVGDPCPLHEEGTVLEEVPASAQPEVAEAEAPTKKRRGIRPRRDPIRMAGVAMHTHPVDDLSGLHGL
jgi:hypothetical protein